MSDPFLDRLIDWKDFELFIHDVYAEDEQLSVEHDVTVTGKSGAKRQIDVRFTHHVKGHTYTTVIECKRWKEPVTRERIDVLASTIEDTGAAKGVMFTTTGYEEGAQRYAAAKNIDLFLVRDLTDQEWGLPGRVVWLYLQIYAAETRDIAMPGAQLITTDPNPPTNISLDFVIAPDRPEDPSLTLYDTIDGSAGPNLLTVLNEARNATLAQLPPQVGLLDDGADTSRSYIIPLVIDLASARHRDLQRPFGIVRLAQITGELHVHISQSRMEFDRGAQHDLALALENYLTRQRNIVTRASAGGPLAVAELTDTAPPAPEEDVLQNGTVLPVITEPWVSIGKALTNAQRLKTATVNIRTEDSTAPAAGPDTQQQDGEA
ncbi:MAG: hypothetical protein JWM60_1650 [Solirubrobacterales bacterium]|nr:hypothetical protein [Solirubrobacterales bacterium]